LKFKIKKIFFKIRQNFFKYIDYENFEKDLQKYFDDLFINIFYKIEI